MGHHPPSNVFLFQYSQERKKKKSSNFNPQQIYHMIGLRVNMSLHMPITPFPPPPSPSIQPLEFVQKIY